MPAVVSIVVITNEGEGMYLSPSQEFCDPVGTRTRNRLLRRQMLYPVELPDRPFTLQR